jgi:hypothetical protein
MSLIYVKRRRSLRESLSDLVSVTTRRQKGMGVDTGKEERAGRVSCVLEWLLILQHHRGNTTYLCMYM